LTHPSLVGYVSLTAGHDPTRMQLRLIEVHESRPLLFELETTVDFPDPLTVLELVFSETSVVFPEPGEYRLQLFGAEEPLLERRLQIVPEENSDQH